MHSRLSAKNIFSIRKSFSWSLLAKILIAAGVLARLFMLDASSLRMDEVGTLLIARQTLPEFLPFAVNLGFAPPLFAFLSLIWRAVGGESVLWLRLLPFIFGVGALVLYWKFCSRYFPRPAAGLALFLGAFSPFWIFHSQNFRMYSLFLFLSLFSTYLFLGIFRNSTGWKFKAAYLLSLTAGLYTHYYFVFTWASHLIAAVAGRRNKEFRPVLACQVISLCAFVPWLAAVAPLLRQSSGVGWMDPEKFLLFLGNFLTGSEALDLIAPGWIRIAGVLGTVFMFLGLRSLVGEHKCGGIKTPTGMAVGRGADRMKPEIIIGLAHIALPLAGILLIEILSGNSFTMVRYFIAFTPFFYLFVASGICSFTGWKRALARGLMISVAITAFSAYYFVRAVVDPGFSKASRIIGLNLRPGEIVVHTSEYWYFPLKYYYAPDHPHYLLVPDRNEAGLTARRLPGHRLIRSLRDPAIGSSAVLLIDPSKTVTGKVVSRINNK